MAICRALAQELCPSPVLQERIKIFIVKVRLVRWGMDKFCARRNYEDNFYYEGIASGKRCVNRFPLVVFAAC